jgi:outer membrane lipoprotein-sorting protein
LPTRIEYRSKNGNTRTIEFHEITLNPDLAASLYEVEIPDGVKVTRGFSGLPDFSDDSAQ